MKNKILLAWISLLGSYIILIVIDYYLRSATGDIKLGGISFLAFWGLWVPFIIYSLYCLYKASNLVRTKLNKILLVLVNLLIATIIILLISFLYTIESGIDSL